VVLKVFNGMVIMTFGKPSQFIHAKRCGKQTFSGTAGVMNRQQTAGVMTNFRLNPSNVKGSATAFRSSPRNADKLDTAIKLINRLIKCSYE